MSLPFSASVYSSVGRGRRSPPRAVTRLAETAVWTAGAPGLLCPPFLGPQLVGTITPTSHSPWAPGFGHAPPGWRLYPLLHLSGPSAGRRARPTGDTQLGKAAASTEAGGALCVGFCIPGRAPGHAGRPGGSSASGNKVPLLPGQRNATHPSCPYPDGFCGHEAAWLLTGRDATLAPQPCPLPTWTHTCPQTDSGLRVGARAPCRIQRCLGQRCPQPAVKDSP